MSPHQGCGQRGADKCFVCLLASLCLDKCLTSGFWRVGGSGPTCAQCGKTTGEQNPGLQQTGKTLIVAFACFRGVNTPRMANNMRLPSVRLRTDMHSQPWATSAGHARLCLAQLLPLGLSHKYALTSQMWLQPELPLDLQSPTTGALGGPPICSWMDVSKRVCF